MQIKPAIVTLLLITGATCGLVLGRVLTTGSFGAQDDLHDRRAAPRPVTPRGDLDQEEKQTIELFKRVSPSVVYITKYGIRYNFFSRDPIPYRAGTGSGIVWSENGYIVTNYHVVGERENGSEWRVTFSEQNLTIDAELAGTAPDKDLAVLKIKTEMKLTPIPVGESEGLQVGQKVFAIGNPFGLDHTLTKGIISALHREISSQIPGRTIADVIQTDAAINPGNSGGPLLDSAGRLIGVNTAIATTSGSSAGIGFAIPVDVVNRIVPQLIKFGYVVRPGIGVVPVDDAVARRLGVEKGVLVKDVTPGSSADDAGLRGAELIEVRRRGYRFRHSDVIIAVDGETVETTNDLLNIFEKRRAGDTVRVSVERDGKEKLDFELKLREIRDQ